MKPNYRRNYKENKSIYKKHNHKKKHAPDVQHTLITSNKNEFIRQRKNENTELFCKNHHLKVLTIGCKQMYK